MGGSAGYGCRIGEDLNAPDNQQALQIYLTDPFDPHAIAGVRIGAYARAAVMKYLDVLIAWGDSLFSTYTSETVAQAEQLYVMADMLLGPRPIEVRAPVAANAAPPTYASIEGSLDKFSDTMITIREHHHCAHPTRGNDCRHDDRSADARDAALLRSAQFPAARVLGHGR